MKRILFPGCAAASLSERLVGTFFGLVRANDGSALQVNITDGAFDLKLDSGP